jgi:hypothetical protein
MRGRHAYAKPYSDSNSNNYTNTDQYTKGYSKAAADSPPAPHSPTVEEIVISER